MTTITVATQALCRSFTEVADDLPTIQHAWLLMDILALQHKHGVATLDLLCDSVYARDGVLQSFLQTLQAKAYVSIEQTRY